MPRIEIVAPGTDPLQRTVNHRRPELPWKWIIALVVILLITFVPIILVKAAKPPGDPKIAAETATRAAAGDFTRTPTPEGMTTETPAASPTASETPILMGVFAQMTGQPTTGANESVSCQGSTTTIRVEVTRVVQAPALACIPSVTTINTEVTRVVTQVVTRQVTQMATQLVTALVTEIVPGASPTPGPTSTPWVIVVEVTRIVEVTSTPTATQEPTATSTPTVTLPPPTETPLIPTPYP